MTNTIPLDAERAAVRRSSALGRAAARAGDPEHPRGDVGLVAVRLVHGTAKRRTGTRTTHGLSHLEATTRDSRGKNEARRLRVAGKIPAVLYGGAERRRRRFGRPEDAVAHPALGLRRQHADQPQGEGGATQVLVKEFLLDPISTRCCTPTSTGWSSTRRSRSPCRSSLKGEAKGVKLQGGILDFPNREVEVECCRPTFPSTSKSTSRELTIGQGVRLKELAEGASGRP